MAPHLLRQNEEQLAPMLERGEPVSPAAYHAGMFRITNVPRAVVAIVLVAVIAACASTTDATEPLLVTGEPPTKRLPIIIDTDLDHSDIAAVMILLRDPAVDVRAITIAGTGLVHCQGGRLVLRYLLDELGSPEIPFGCGRENGGPDARPFPDDWRAVADRGYGLEIPPKVESGFPSDAVDVLVQAVDASPSAPTIVLLGPLTNLEDAFVADPSLADRVAGIHAMLGTIEAPGNVFVDGLSGADPLEWNAFADPSAVAAVFATDVPVDIVPLDATDDVPVPADLADRLATDRAAGGADLLYELLVRHPARLRADEGQQLWDEVAALALTDPDLVTWSHAAVVVGDDGRLTQDEDGRTVRFAIRADRPAVEMALLKALRRGGPRLTPFQLSGELTVGWDGTTCSMQPFEEIGPGVARVTFENASGRPAGVILAGVLAPHTWGDLEGFLKDLDLETATPPDWVVEGASLNDDAGTGAPVSGTMAVRPATYGPICGTGTWPDIVFTAGTPFDVPAAP